ncbi:MAG: 16S rRNA (guanine(966)-N(2))-methyltransferase RsmD [Dehalococcoidia bacterium]|nr:16S rRNA (guanine(966)-N(2))-methyltransferase RsmD [Dehalococcoidia bacterium]
MRVIAGAAKGHRIKAPRGSSVRPTSDMVRGAIFSMLEAMGVEWGRVLDLYAGTGAMGIEALSRGAEWLDSVEQDSRNCAVIKDNLEHTGFSEEAKVHCCSTEKALSFLQEGYDLVFVDPPYADPDLPSALRRLFSSKALTPRSTVVIEHSRRRALEGSYGGFHLTRELRHGDTRVSVYRFRESQEG